jgi:hypothetical protein
MGTKVKRRGQHRKSEAALELSHAESKLCLAEGSDGTWLQLQMRQALR